MKPVTDPALLAALEGGGGKPVTDPALLAQLEGEKKPEGTDWARQAGLVGKAAFQGVTSLPMFAADMLDMPKAAIAKATGVPHQSPSELLQGFIDPITDSPKTRGERLTTDVVAGTAGALTGGPGKLLTALAGGAGGFGGGYVREEGGGPVKQIIAALLTSLAPVGAVKAAKPIANIIDSTIIPGGGKRAAVRTTANIVDDKDAIAEALLKAKPGQTAAQAAAPAASPEFSALEKITREADPSKFQAVDDAQQAARAAKIKEIAGSQEALEKAKIARAADAKSRYGAIKDTKVDPRSEQQIASGKIKEAEQRTQAAKDADFVPVPGMPRVPSGLNPDVARKAADEDALKSAVDLMKNTMGLENKSMTALMDRPSMKSALSAAMKGAEESGSYFPKKPGQKFSVENLQRMKQALDDFIKDPALSGIKGTEAAEITKTRAAFVDWLESAVPEWRSSRIAYKEASKPINKMVVGAELEKALTSSTGKERAGVFTNAVDNAGRIPELRKKSGANRFGSAADVLDEAEMGKVREVADDLRTDVRVDDLAAAGMPKARNEYFGQLEGLSLPQMLSRPIMVANAILDRLEGAGSKRTTDALSELMRPEGVKDFGMRLKDYSKDDIRSLIIEALMAGGKGGIAQRRERQ